MKKVFFAAARGLRSAIVAVFAIVGTGAGIAVANYTMTQGAGTNFGSIIVSTVHYAQQLFCDPTTPSQCAGVNPSGQVAIQAPPSLPLPSGAATQTTVAAINTVSGTVADAAGCGSSSTIRGCLGQIDADVKGSVAAGTNVIGKVGVDQTTFGTTNGVVNAANTYQAVAASQTAVVLGTTGAIGDYLSHCIIYPTSTTPGAVTVFDNTNTAANSAILFPGGASSVSNLVPITIAVAAKSVNGGWKVTTVANESVVCVGKFT